MGMRRLIVVMLAILPISGCATYAWQKPGVTGDVAQQDVRECNRQAQAIASDYAFGPGPVYPYGWYGGPWRGAPPGLAVGPDPAWQLDLEQRARDRCMEVKGYTLVKLPRKSSPAS